MLQFDKKIKVFYKDKTKNNNNHQKDESPKKGR